MDKVIWRVELSPSAKQKVEELCEKQGMKQGEVLSRLLEWFSRQPEPIKALAVGLYPPEAYKELAPMLLKGMEKAGRRSR